MAKETPKLHAVTDGHSREDTTTPTETAAPDPFNIDELRLSQDFEAATGVRKLLTTVPVRKPHK
jgi:hypothetical protein